MRTTVSKITKKKSGDEARPLTDKQKWIMESFGFLKNQMHRMVTRKRVVK